ncbi:hypothetical protein OAD75_06080 [Gammaproteobacteria bacterium]|nr:hypothetical protein [Gammaproteobacteria bacterium]
MAFINNVQDNFKKSDSAWGDDNITIYNSPSPSLGKGMGIVSTQDMSYQDIEDTISQISSVEPSNMEDMTILRRKLDALEIEKSKRDELESVTRVERDDAFEPQETTIKEDVIETTKEPIELGLPVDDMLINDGYIEPENKTNDLIIAGLIIILVIKFID